RVRVDAFMKIIASDLPASGMRSYRPSRIASASRKRDSSSSLEKSGMARKSRCKTGWVEGKEEVGLPATSWQQPASSCWKLATGCWLLAAPRTPRNGLDWPLKDVLPQILVVHDCLEAVAHGGAVHIDRVGTAVGEVEQRVLEQRSHDRVQAAGSDVLHPVVNGCRYPRDLLDPVFGEGERGPFCLNESGVLLGECVLGLGHDAHEVLLRERLQLDTNREAALQLRNEIARLRHMKRTGSDEEHMVRLHQAVLRLDVGAFHDGQEVPLHTLTRDIRSARVRP